MNALDSRGHVTSISKAEAKTALRLGAILVTTEEGDALAFEPGFAPAGWDGVPQGAVCIGTRHDGGRWYAFPVSWGRE